MVMPMVKPTEATITSWIGFTPKRAAAATSAGLPKGIIVPASIVARKMPAKP